MAHIAIISPSLRNERRSHCVALYLKSFIEENNFASAEILDLLEYNFPLFNERLKYQKEPSSQTLEFAQKIKDASGVIIIAPEYNGGYPASLKNVIDLLYDEWYHKPVAISTVSSGPFGGSQVIMQLQFVLWKMKALIIPAVFPLPNIAETLDEFGIPSNKVALDKRARMFVNELLWAVQAVSHMEK